MTRLLQDLRLQAGLIIIVCALVYWPMLGSSGFSASEGHRVIPGWEMREPGRFASPFQQMQPDMDGRVSLKEADPSANVVMYDGAVRWLVPHMFGQPYLRKPPGMPWAVAISSWIFGESEWSARGVSALATSLASLVTFFFATRWFGRPWGLAAGLVHALTPWLWSSGRSAEIEAINNFATHAAVLLALDIMIGPAARSPARAAGRVLLAALAIIAAGLAKGPAGAPVLGAALLSAMIVKRSWRVLVKPSLLGALAVAGIVLGLVAYMTFDAAHRAGSGVITQGVSDFMWDIRKLKDVLLLPFAALAAGMPGSLALFFAWSPAGRAALSPRQREAELGHHVSGAASPATDEASIAGPSDMARALALTCLLSMAILIIAGVHNPRYAMPAMAIPAVLIAHAGSVAASGRDAKGTRLWSILTLKRAWLVPALLLLAAAVYIPLSESRRERTSGRAAGRAIAEAIPGLDVELWADHMVEARPEVLLYANIRAEELGHHIKPVWKRPSPTDLAPMPAPGDALLLRSDASSDEVQRYTDAGQMPKLQKLTTGRVHKFEFVLYFVTP